MLSLFCSFKAIFPEACWLKLKLVPNKLLSIIIFILPQKKATEKYFEAKWDGIDQGDSDNTLGIIGTGT